MSPDAIRAAVLAALARVAPEADPATIPGHLPWREELDVDSMDFLRFVVQLHETLGFDIPESDYPQLATLDGTVAYLGHKLAAKV